jgi:hypothetical protein
MRNDASVAAMLVTCFLLSGCGGRVSRPVAAHEPYDDQLDCAHLTAEKSVNTALARDLTGEQANDANNNLGQLLLNPLFLNLSGSEQRELEAFAAREKVLDQLIARKCPKTADKQRGSGQSFVAK